MTTHLFEVGLACVLLGGVSLAQTTGAQPASSRRTARSRRRRSRTCSPVPPARSRQRPGSPAAQPESDIEFRMQAAYQRLTGGDLPALEECATAGDPEALFLLGQAYIDGQIVERNVEKGLALHRRSAAQGFRPAEMALADRYAAGDRRRP